MNQSLFTSQLNPQQLEAVESLHGPLLILAGAGSGKTRVLTYRIAQLIALGEASPSQILGVTFTNKAAKEMGHRVYTLLDKLGIPVYEPMWINTFHSNCVRILRDDIHYLDYTPYFGIYDGSDQLSLVKKCLNKLNINDKLYPAKGFLSSINSAKTYGLDPLEVEKDQNFYMDDRTLNVYRHYEEELKKSNSLDFNDLLIKTNLLFKNFPEVRNKYSEMFQYIMVDEY
ncbi:MAG: UvrD-helicase domain-containing protein, partial [Bdellovibrionales bacterium]|nr:UvrD-helicase domain-containing protein [Bdellovibrionales bacterium]